MLASSARYWSNLIMCVNCLGFCKWANWERNIFVAERYNTFAEYIGRVVYRAERGIGQWQKPFHEAVNNYSNQPSPVSAIGTSKHHRTITHVYIDVAIYVFIYVTLNSTTKGLCVKWIVKISHQHNEMYVKRLMFCLCRWCGTFNQQAAHLPNIKSQWQALLLCVMSSTIQHARGSLKLAPDYRRTNEWLLQPSLNGWRMNVAWVLSF